MYIYDKVDSLPLPLPLSLSKREKRKKGGGGALFVIYNVGVMEDTPPFFFIYVINKFFFNSSKLDSCT